jgi:hypothetical protein
MVSDMVQKILSVGYNFITSGMGESQYPDPGSGIRDEQAWSYLLKLRNDFFAFFEVKILCWGSRMETIRIRDGKK